MPGASAARSRHRHPDAVSRPRSAQDAYREMLTKTVSPGLRELGFVGTRGRYQLPNEQYWVVMDLQRSRGSNRDNVWFTVNLGAIGRGTWPLLRFPTSGMEPLAGALSTISNVSLGSRLGHLMPVNRDLWWDLFATDDAARVAAVGAEVVDAMREHGLPWLLEGLKTLRSR